MDSQDLSFCLGLCRNISIDVTQPLKVASESTKVQKLILMDYATVYTAIHYTVRENECHTPSK